MPLVWAKGNARLIAYPMSVFDNDMPVDGVKCVVMMHRSPLDLRNDGRIRLSGDGNHLPESRADVLVVGNTHWPMIARTGRALIINPGSLGDLGTQPTPINVPTPFWIP